MPTVCLLLVRKHCAPYRDESSLVGIEAIRALAGHFPPRKASLGLDGKVVEVSAQDVRCRGRAWQVSCCDWGPCCKAQDNVHARSR